MSTSELYFQLFIFLVYTPFSIQEKQPHIIFILADDLGWNDVGFHGSAQIPTPNIDALAYSGLILNNHYASHLCTPSRSALMTGKYPIRTGMQHYVIKNLEPWGLPLTERLFPEHLRSLGYVTHMIGKWHLGNYKNVYTPLERGFDTFLGYTSPYHDYFDHTYVEDNVWGMDLKRGYETAWDMHGKYTTDIFTDEAVRLINTHNDSKPMFLYLAHAAVHHGNSYNFFPVPDEDIEKVQNVDNLKRRRYTAMTMKLDDSVGRVIDALNQQGMLNDSVIVFVSDNGGFPLDLNLPNSAGSNWPLRGAKFALWEGGVHTVGLVWSPKISQPQRVSNQLMHIVDWLPTLYGLAGGSLDSLGDIDGIDMWESLSENKESRRTLVLHNIDDTDGTAALRKDQWKIVKGSVYNGSLDSWYGPSGVGYTYDVENVLNSKTGLILASLGQGFTAESALDSRKEATLNCMSPKNKMNSCDPFKATCLFDIIQDPCEMNNLAEEFPEIVETLEKTLDELNATAIPPRNVPRDIRGDPKYWNYTWTNFGDYLDMNFTATSVSASEI